MRLSTKLTTQCPQCGGQFDVSMAQLQLRKGFVRCVHCAHIFDGYETVVPEGEDVSVPSDQPSDHIALSAHPAVIRQRHAVTLQAPAREDAVFSISDPPPETVEHAPDEPLLSADGDSMPPELAEAIYVERRTPPAPVPAALPDFLGEARQRNWMFWCWSALSVLALLLALAQAAVIYRVQAAHAFPAARPLLERLCGGWGCQVEYPRFLHNIAILSSSLRMQPRTDQGKDVDSRLVLHLTLRNQDMRAQQWPTLLLDLTDFSGAVVIRRHLHPSDYLPQDLAGKPFAGASEVALRLPMAVQGVAVNGYQIKPFFP